MTIDIRFLDTDKSHIPDHIRITKSILGETGTFTFSFYDLTFLNARIKNMESLYQLRIFTEKHIYTTKDIRILWANGHPSILQAVFVIHNKELFDYLFKHLQYYALEKGFTFFQTEENLENMGM